MKKTPEKHQKQNKKRELPGCERIVSDKGGWLLGQGKSTIHQAQVLNDLSSGKLVFPIERRNNDLIPRKRKMQRIKGFWELISRSSNNNLYLDENKYVLVACAS